MWKSDIYLQALYKSVPGLESLSTDDIMYYTELYTDADEEVIFDTPRYLSDVVFVEFLHERLKQNDKSLPWRKMKKKEWELHDTQ